MKCYWKNDIFDRKNSFSRHWCKPWVPQPFEPRCHLSITSVFSFSYIPYPKVEYDNPKLTQSLPYIFYYFNIYVLRKRERAARVWKPGGAPALLNPLSLYWCLPGPAEPVALTRGRYRWPYDCLFLRNKIKKMLENNRKQNFDFLYSEKSLKML